MGYDLSLIGCDIGGICACYVLDKIQARIDAPGHVACNGFCALSLVVSDLYPAKTRDALLEKIYSLRKGPRFSEELWLLLSDLKNFRPQDLKTPLLFYLAELSDRKPPSLRTVSQADSLWYSSSLYEIVLSTLSPYFVPAQAAMQYRFCDAAVYFGCCSSVFSSSAVNQNMAVFFGAAKNREELRLVSYRRLVELTLGRFQHQLILSLDADLEMEDYIAKATATVEKEEEKLYQLLFPTKCHRI